ncbi:uncharacterized protein [Hyperolius riggenbachi]|uniref:uncharacterized protein n=1 Tax=Hyperolius riggenbachi TaxID=752182 RepID=UPI0035A29976
MAALPTYGCTMCRTQRCSPQEMAFHVMREKEHRKMLAFYDPKGVKELARLQYFLDTHMREEPILGLEYIVEEQLEPEKYRYTCQLCHLRADAYTIFRHILKEKHTMGYIANHHPSLLKMVENPNKTHHLRELRALAIQNDHERKEIQRKQSGTQLVPCNRPVDEKAIPTLITQRGVRPVDEKAIPTLITQRGVRKCPIYKQASPPPATQRVFLDNLTCKQASPPLATQRVFLDNLTCKQAPPPPATQRVFLDNLTCKQASPPLATQKVSHICPICNVYNDSVIHLFYHIFGKRHRKVAYRDVIKLDRMQYILDNYVKKDPIVGLEYVVERQVSGSYRYTCSLCDVEADLCQSLIHVVGVDHMERYIRKHYKRMLPRSQLTTMEDVRESALIIQSKYGRKKIHTKKIKKNTKKIHTTDSFVSGSSPTEEARPSPTEEARPSPTEEARPSPTEEARPLPPNVVSEESWLFLHDGKGLDNYHPCRLCNVVCLSPVGLWNHVVGSKHKKMLSKTSPQELKELGRLQYFLNNHMKKDPLLGLEYIVEEQLDSTSYKYTCQLCNVKGYLPQMIIHISCVDHVERYIDKDHSDLSLRVYTYPERADYIKALTKIARIILEKCGRQDIVQLCT